MNEENIKKYHAHLKEKIDRKIDFHYAKKDYLLSKFLSEWQKLTELGKIEELNKLIFKGGTLLSRNYLKYHRISEDLDFTHSKCLEIRKIESKNKRDKTIKPLMKKLISEIKLISDNLKFKFETNTKNKDFIIIKNSRHICIFKIYYGKELSDYVKFEINFVEDLINNPNKIKINNLNNLFELDEILLGALGHNLNNLEIRSYSQEEIILEKFRAILTRKTIKERDLFDLYLINKSTNIFNTDNNLILRKINSGNFTMNESEGNFLSKKILITQNLWGNVEEDIDTMVLMDFNKKDFESFKKELLKKLKELYK